MVLVLIPRNSTAISFDPVMVSRRLPQPGYDVAVDRITLPVACGLHHGTIIVEDTVDNCAAYVFCGFWNSAFGHNFTGKRNQRVRHPDAYNGPPPQAAAMAHELKQLESAHEIATRLRKAVVENEADYMFNHQNAWNRTELIELLARSGFRVVSLDRPELIGRFSKVSGIEQMAELSLYCHAVPD